MVEVVNAAHGRRRWGGSGRWGASGAIRQRAVGADRRCRGGWGGGRWHRGRGLGGGRGGCDAVVVGATPTKQRRNQQDDRLGHQLVSLTVHCGASLDYQSSPKARTAASPLREARRSLSLSQKQDWVRGGRRLRVFHGQSRRIRPHRRV